MRYNYNCPNCEKESVVSKSMSECSREEFCLKCGTKLTRTYSFAVKTNDGFKGS